MSGKIPTIGKRIKSDVISKAKLRGFAPKDFTSSARVGAGVIPKWLTGFSLAGTGIPLIATYFHKLPLESLMLITGLSLGALLSIAHLAFAAKDVPGALHEDSAKLIKDPKGFQLLTFVTKATKQKWDAKQAEYTGLMTYSFTPDRARTVNCTTVGLSRSIAICQELIADRSVLAADKANIRELMRNLRRIETRVLARDGREGRYQGKLMRELSHFP